MLFDLPREAYNKLRSKLTQKIVNLAGIVFLFGGIRPIYDIRHSCGYYKRPFN